VLSAIITDEEPDAQGKNRNDISQTVALRDNNLNIISDYKTIKKNMRLP
jgi:hypothetical protein